MLISTAIELQVLELSAKANIRLRVIQHTCELVNFIMLSCLMFVNRGACHMTSLLETMLLPIVLLVPGNNGNHVELYAHKCL